MALSSSAHVWVNTLYAFIIYLKTDHSKIKTRDCVWCYIPAIPVARKQRQEELTESKRVGSLAQVVARSPLTVLKTLSSNPALQIH
jgi:hypothetical protein